MRNFAYTYNLPQTKEQEDELERIQRRVLKMIFAPAVDIRES